jgi:hypothetical protein
LAATQSASATAAALLAAQAKAVAANTAFAKAAQARAASAQAAQAKAAAARAAVVRAAQAKAASAKAASARAAQAKAASAQAAAARAAHAQAASAKAASVRAAQAKAASAVAAQVKAAAVKAARAKAASDKAAAVKAAMARAALTKAAAVRAAQVKAASAKTAAVKAARAKAASAKAASAKAASEKAAQIKADGRADADQAGRTKPAGVGQAVRGGSAAAEQAAEAEAAATAVVAEKAARAKAAQVRTVQSRAASARAATERAKQFKAESAYVTVAADDAVQVEAELVRGAAVAAEDAVQVEAESVRGVAVRGVAVAAEGIEQVKAESARVAEIARKIKAEQAKNVSAEAQKEAPADPMAARPEVAETGTVLTGVVVTNDKRAQIESARFEAVAKMEDVHLAGNFEHAKAGSAATEAAKRRNLIGTNREPLVVPHTKGRTVATTAAAAGWGSESPRLGVRAVGARSAVRPLEMSLLLDSSDAGMIREAGVLKSAARRKARRRRGGVLVGVLGVAVAALLVGQAVRGDRPATVTVLPAASALPAVKAPPSVPARANADSVDVAPTRVAASFRFVGGYGPMLGRAGTVREFRVAVERGLGQGNGTDFAEQVDAVLGDRRSWIASKDFKLQRVPRSVPTDFTIYLASARTSTRLCADGGLSTDGFTSCRLPGQIIINADLWAKGSRSYAAKLADYRAYTVNHEVGHQFGYGHEACLGRGEPAPVMQQQTYGLRGCHANSWPYLDGKRYAGEPVD